eukprot:16431598-Heterocapsa_arctica.AAC.1
MNDLRLVNNPYIEDDDIIGMWDSFQVACDEYDHVITRTEYEEIVDQLVDFHPAVEAATLNGFDDSTRAPPTEASDIELDSEPDTASCL